MSLASKTFANETCHMRQDWVLVTEIGVPPKWKHMRSVSWGVAGCALHSGRSKWREQQTAIVTTMDIGAGHMGFINL